MRSASRSSWNLMQGCSLIPECSGFRSPRNRNVSGRGLRPHKATGVDSLVQWSSSSTESRKDRWPGARSPETRRTGTRSGSGYGPSRWPADQSSTNFEGSSSPSTRSVIFFTGWALGRRGSPIAQTSVVAEVWSGPGQRPALSCEPRILGRHSPPPSRMTDATETSSRSGPE